MKYYKGAYGLFSNRMGEIDDFPDEHTEEMPVIVAAESQDLVNGKILSDGMPKTENWVNTTTWPSLYEITIQEYEKMKQHPGIIIKE